MTCRRLAKMIIRLQNNASMNSAHQRTAPSLFRLFSLWGMDVAIASLCWCVLVAEHLRITMLTVGPLLVLSASIWLVVMLGRIAAGLGGRTAGNAAYYRSHLAPLLPVWVAVLCATLWMLFFRVGQSLLHFGILPLSFLGAARFPLLRRMREYAAWCCACAFVFACAAPAYYYSFSLSPLHVVGSTPLWLLAAVFFLFFSERQRVACAEGARSVLIVICHLLLFVCCVNLAVREPAYMRVFYVSLSMSVAVLHVLSRLRSRLPDVTWYALGWPLLTLPALAGILASTNG